MFKLDFHPSLEDYRYIRSWMEVAKEKQLANWGLIYNLHEEDFEKGKVVVYRQNNKAEAFITTIDKNPQKVLNLEIMSLNPDYYHRGIGSKFFKALFKYYIKKGVVVCEAYKPSHKGLRLVNKFGFFKKEYGCTGYEDYRVKFLIAHRKQNWTANRRLVLWDSDDTNKKPIKSWSLNTSQKSKPILIYAFRDWQIGIVENDKIVFSDKVKYYPIICDCVEDNYLYMHNQEILKLIEWRKTNLE